MAKPIVTIVCVLVVGGAVGAYLMKNSSPGFRNEYAWQKTCDSHCAAVVGKSDMAQIDAAGCADLNIAIGFSLTFDKDHLAAINDKIAFTQCPPPPKPVDPAAAAAQMMKNQPSEAELQRIRCSMGLKGGLYPDCP